MLCWVVKQNAEAPLSELNKSLIFKIFWDKDFI